MKAGFPAGDGTWQTGSPGRRERVEATLEWYLTPVGSRVPATQAEFAESLNVSAETVRRYTKDPWFQREKVQRERTLNRVERVGDILESLYLSATDAEKPSVPAAKAWLDWVSKTVDVPEQDRDLADMTLDELQSMVAELRADELDEDAADLLGVSLGE